MPGPINRLESFRKFVAARPDDAFARYGLAMELKSQGQREESRREFEELERRAPEYVAQYYQHAALLIELGLREEAKGVIGRGIPAAQKKGDGHAAGELQGLLDGLG